MFRTTTRRPRTAALAIMALTAAAGLALPASAAGPGVHGRVYGTDQCAVAGATVEFKDASGRVAASAATDAGGYYRADLVAGTYTYTVRAAGYQSEDSSRGIALRLSEGYAVYDFTLTPGADAPGRAAPEPPAAAVARLRGQVYERTAGGELVGVNGAEVTLRGTGGGPPVRVINRPPGDAARADSGYELTLEAGAWRASVRTDGFETLVDDQPIDATADKLAIRDFVLKRLTPPADLRLVAKPTELLVRVLDAGDRTPLRGASVLVRAVSGPDRTPRRYQTDEGGSAVHRAAGVGEYQALAALAGYEPAGGQTLSLTEGGRREVTFLLRKVAPVVGTPAVDVGIPGLVPPPRTTVLVVRVTDGQQPLRGARVSVSTGKVPLAEGASDVNGLCSLQLPGPGAYVLSVSLSGHATYQGPITLAVGENRQTVTLARVRKPTLSILVREAGQAKVVPVAGAKVEVRQKGRVVAGGVADQLGRFRADLEPGVYEVVAAKDRYRLEQPVNADVMRGDVQSEVSLAPIRSLANPGPGAGSTKPLPQTPDKGGKPSPNTGPGTGSRWKSDGPAPKPTDPVGPPSTSGRGAKPGEAVRGVKAPQP